MQVKDAIEAAKAYVLEVYDASEDISDVGLEEVQFDRAEQTWLITIGFSRPDKGSFRALARQLIESSSGHALRRRVQKVVVVSKDGVALAMKNREAA